MPNGAEETPAGSNNARLALIVGVVAVVIVAIVAVVLLTGGDSDDSAGDITTAESAPAPPNCVNAWAKDEEQLDAGIHMYNDHDVEYAWVFYMGFDRKPTDDPEMSECLVVFPLEGFEDLGKELPNVAQQFKGRADWFPYIEQSGVTQELISELRAESFNKINATLAADGTLTALPAAAPSTS